MGRGQRQLIGLTPTADLAEQHLRMGLDMLNQMDVVLVQEALVPYGLTLFDWLFRVNGRAAGGLSHATLLAHHQIVREFKRITYGREQAR